MTNLDALKDTLRDLVEDKLSLYVREIGADFFVKLIANKSNWRAGYASAHDYYCCTPRTGGKLEYTLVGPFTALKWTRSELIALGVPEGWLDAGVDEMRQAGFQQWANPTT